MKPHGVTDLELLKLGHDALRVAHLAADQIFEPDVAVEPALVLLCRVLYTPGTDAPFPFSLCFPSYARASPDSLRKVPQSVR
jgi:hypothetical protein